MSSSWAEQLALNVFLWACLATFFFKLIGGAYYPAWRVAKEQQQLR